MTVMHANKAVYYINSVPARKFCLRAEVAPTTHFWGPDFSRKKVVVL